MINEDEDFIGHCLLLPLLWIDDVLFSFYLEHFGNDHSVDAVVIPNSGNGCLSFVHVLICPVDYFLPDICVTLPQLSGSPCFVVGVPLQMLF